MGRKKDKLYHNISITGFGHKAKGVGRAEDGRVLFVEKTAPGDIVDVLVYKRRKSIYEGRPVHFHNFSEDRTEPFCQHFGKCGGCKLQHVSYESQLKHKQIQVENALMRIGKIEVKEFLPILPSEKKIYYRNKVEYTFSCKKWLTREEIDSGVSNRVPVAGYFPGGAFDKIINIEHCYLQEDPSNNLRNTARELAIKLGFDFYDAKAHKGHIQLMMIRMATTGQIMLVFCFRPEIDREKMKDFLDQMLDKFPNITSLYYCINPKVNDVLYDLDMELYAGKAKIEETLGDVRFLIGPKSFFQTNSTQAVQLFDVVKSFANLQGDENIYDLYTGIGSIALYLASSCKQVVGIEEVAPAIEDARVNAELNNVENAIFYVGDVKNILSDNFAQRHGTPDLVITDPPRAGMHPKVVEILLKLASPRIIYVSCNPATQARDLNLLSEKYEVLKVRPVDMFPHTHHIENVALLTLK